MTDLLENLLEIETLVLEELKKAFIPVVPQMKFYLAHDLQTIQKNQVPVPSIQIIIRRLKLLPESIIYDYKAHSLVYQIEFEVVVVTKNVSHTEGAGSREESGKYAHLIYTTLHGRKLSDFIVTAEPTQNPFHYEDGFYYLPLLFNAKLYNKLYNKP